MLNVEFSPNGLYGVCLIQHSTLNIQHSSIMIIKSLAMEGIALLMQSPISSLWEWGLEYQSPSDLPLLAQVLIRIVAIKDYLLLRWKCSYLPNHTPPVSWAEFHPPPHVSQVGAKPWIANTRLIWAKHLSNGGVFSIPTTIVCISFITFLYSYLKARKLSFVWKVPMHCIKWLSRKKMALSR